MKYKQIFITVGTTKFDSLIKLFTDQEILQILKETLGCSRLVVQYGNGEKCDFSVLTENGISVESYNLKPSILEDIVSSDLVISHAGAGTCIEVLRARKPLVVVINEDLMDNHQLELAEQLFSDGYLIYCTPSSLAKTLVKSDLKSLKKFEKGNMQKFVKELDALMGFS